MLKEGKYTLSELRVAIQESEQKSEFKAKLGKGVESGNKENNKKAVDDTAKKTGKYNPEKEPHTVILPDDRNKTTIDVVWNELKPGKEWEERVEAQAEGYPSVENKKNTDARDNGGLEYEDNKEFYKHREKLLKDRKQTIKDDMDAGLKGRMLTKYNVVNETFDYENDEMTTKDWVAKDFLNWAFNEAETTHDYPINAAELIHDAYVNNDNDALEEVATAYFESKYTDMSQWDVVLAGVEKAIDAYGYYNLSNDVPQDKEEEESETIDTETEDDITEPEPLEDEEPEPLDEVRNSKMKRLHYKNTVFLNEQQILNRVPEEFKTDGNRFYVKDASGTEYLVECLIDEQFDYPKLTVVSKLNENKANGELDRMRQLFGYESSEYFTKAEKSGETVNRLHEQLERMRKLK